MLAAEFDPSTIVPGAEIVFGFKEIECKTVHCLLALARWAEIARLSCFATDDPAAVSARQQLYRKPIALSSPM